MVVDVLHVVDSLIHKDDIFCWVFGQNLLKLKSTHNFLHDVKDAKKYSQYDETFEAS